MLKEYLKKVRLKRNMSQEQFSKLIGTSQSYYSRLENGRVKPGFLLINRIAEALNVDVSFIRSLL